MSNSKPKVVIIYKVFNHYRKPIFDELAKKVDLTLLHTHNEAWVKSANAPYSKKVSSVFYGKKPSQVYLFVIRELLRIKPDVIIHEFNPSAISLHTSFLYAKLFKKKFIVWGHGFNRKTTFNPSTSFVQKLRLWYMKQANAVLLYGQEDKKRFASYVDKNKIFVAQNTLDTDALSALFHELTSEGLQTIKDEIGITHKHNLLYIGRLVKGKFPELLLDVNSFLLDKGVDVGIHYIGGGEMSDVIKDITKERGMDNVYMHGAIHDDAISAKYLFISDLMVLPGALGLSVNHAFCFNCPVVSYERDETGPFHGPELEYIIQDKTGYLAKNGRVDNMSEWIFSYLQDESKQASMRREIEHMVSDVFPKSKMLEGIVDAIKY